MSFWLLSGSRILLPAIFTPSDLSLCPGASVFAGFQAMLLFQGKRKGNISEQLSTFCPIGPSSHRPEPRHQAACSLVGGGESQPARGSKLCGRSRQGRGRLRKRPAGTTQVTEASLDDGTSDPRGTEMLKSSVGGQGSVFPGSS